MAPGEPAALRSPQPARLAHLLVLLAMAMLVACIYRLIWVETHRGAALRSQAAGQQRSQTHYLGCRGAIVDSNPVQPHQHAVLAVSLPVDSVFVDPQELDPRWRSEVVDALGNALALGASKRERLLSRLAGDAASSPAAAGSAGPADGAEEDDLPAGRSPSRFVWVKRLISREESARIRKLCESGRFRGVGLMPELKRDYPAGQLASHVVGFVGEFGEALEGMEKAYDDNLAGTDGSKRVIADARRRPIWSSELDYVRPQDGLTVVLNINAVIQSHTEQVLEETVNHFKAESGVAVVMDPRTGAVLAMANRPTYSPTDFRIAAQDHRRNRALTDPFEPGSIFKWAVVAGAIDKRIVRETDVFNCRGGTWVHNGRTIRDVHGYGDLTVRKIVVKSSNIGMAQIGLKMGQQRLHECLTAFGFGRKTGIELATVENTGLLYPLSRWTSYSTPSISFGQEITVTPIQMVTAFSALCNGGYLYRPKLVKALVDRSAGVGGAARVVEDYSQPVGQRILSEATARTMVDILTEAVEEGTGQKAKSSRRIRIFGKTGTAQIAERGVYVHGKWTASFICGGQFLDQPDRSPSVVVLVSIRKPDPKVGYYGGTVAAPAARQIVEKALAFLQPLN